MLFYIVYMYGMNDETATVHDGKNGDSDEQCWLMMVNIWMLLIVTMMLNDGKNEDSDEDCAG